MPLPALPAGSQSLDLAQAPIKEIIRRAKDGSVEHIEALIPRILGAYERHSTAILDALLAHLKPPPSGIGARSVSLDLSPGIVSLQAMCEVNRWYILHRNRSPLTVATSIRLFSASDDYVCWAQAFMRETGSLNDEEHLLASYQITTNFFHSLITTPTRIVQALSEKPVMLDLAIQWWISMYDGNPIMYADGMPHQKATRDHGMAVFRQLTSENPRGMAKAILDGRVCTPALFVQRVLDRAHCLVRLNELKQLSERRPATLVHTRENFLTLLDTTRQLRECDTVLRKLFRKVQILTVFMETLDAIRQMPSGGPEDTERSRAAGMLEMLELVLDWVMCTPWDLIPSMQTVVEGGFLAHIGDCVRFAQERDSRCIFVTKLLVTYATYPKVLSAILTGLASHVTPKMHYLKHGSAQHSYLNSLASNLEPLRKMIAIENQMSLCDNIKCPRTQSAFVEERVCSGCHAAAYCSNACQVEDWDALHRRECPEMRRIHLESRFLRTHYPYRYRKYHTSLTRTFYESCEVVRRTITYTQNKWHEYDPCNVTQSIIILPEDTDRAPGWGTDLETYLTRTLRDQNVIPPHLRPRFDAFIPIFRQSVSVARQKPSTPMNLRRGPGKFSIPNDSPGSIRFAERAFQWGNREKTVVLLMEQLKEIPIYTAPFPLLAEAKALQSARATAWGQPIFRIFASFVYECPTRTFASADVVPFGRT